MIAETFGTEHHKFTVDSTQLTEHLPACFEAMSEPMVSHDNIAFYLLSQKVAEHVKVVESGQGADEIFGGYFWYPPLMESRDPVADYAKGFFDRNHERDGGSARSGVVRAGSQPPVPGSNSSRLRTPRGPSIRLCIWIRP